MLQKLGQMLADFLGDATPFDQSASGKDTISDMLDFDALSSLLSYRMFDCEYGIYENSSSVGFVLEAVPLLGGSKEAARELNTFVREILEEGSNIQFLLFADPRIDRFFHSWAEPRLKKGNVFAKIVDKKRLFLEQAFQDSEISPRVFRCFFSYSEPKSEQTEIQPLFERIVEKKQKALQMFSRITQAFEMAPDQLIELLSGLFHIESFLSAVKRRRWDKNNWISKQVCLPGSALEVHEKNLIFHGNEKKMVMRTYEAVDVPSNWSLGLCGEWIGDFLNPAYRIGSPFYIHHGVHVPVQKKAQTRFQAKRKMLEHQSKFPALVKMRPDIVQEMQESSFVSAQLAEGDMFVETRLSCGLWGFPEKFCKTESTLKALFQKYGFSLRENHFLHLPDFLSSLPMMWGESSASMEGLKRMRCMRTTLSQEIGYIAPCVAEWWGNSSQGLMLTGRRGQMFSWDPFSTEGNLNTVVVGPSGSGKSVFMQEMIVSHLGQGGRVFVLDLGRSFEKLCLFLGGQNLVFSEKSCLALNPFNFLKEEFCMETLNAELEMVICIVETMAMPLQKIDQERRDLLSTLVQKAWNLEKTSATIDTVIRLIDTMQFNSQLMIGAAESLKEGLKKYSQNGMYANFFYGANRVDFSNDFVVIETEELKQMPDLQAVVLQIFSLTIAHQIFSADRGKRCLICIDEAWDLLKSPHMENFIENLARRLRKYNGALVVGTQSIKDFERSHGARAAFQNANWLLMLGKDNDGINALKKDNLIPMDPFKESALQSLRMQAGKYSEIFFYHKASALACIGQLRLDPFSSLLYSTRADEFQAVEELKNHFGVSVEEAIEWLLHMKLAFGKLLASGKTVKEAVLELKKS